MPQIRELQIALVQARGASGITGIVAVCNVISVLFVCCDTFVSRYREAVLIVTLMIPVRYCAELRLQ